MVMARADGADLLLSLLNPRAYPIRAETQYVSVPITLDLIVVERSRGSCINDGETVPQS